jgi:lipopolysaccharide/colanic/teichoic acid biosynthesis glycosyltransferase/nitrate reductase NapE component
MLSFGRSVFWRLYRAPVDSDTIFIGSSPHLFAALATQVAARMRRVPFLFEVRDLWPETLVGMTGRVGFQGWVLRLIANHLYRAGAAIIVLTAHARKHIASLGIDEAKIEVVPNGVDLEAFMVRDDASPIPLPRNKKLFLYAGAHGQANDLEVLIRAAKVLEDRGVDDIRILLVGDGPSKDALMTLAKDLTVGNVLFRDPIPKQRIPALLANVDAGVLTLQDVPVFRFGVSPNKLFDYMAARLPVVTNVQGEVASVIHQANCGVLAPPADPQGLAQAMTQLRDLLNQDPTFGDSGFVHVQQHHDRAKLAARMRQLIVRIRARKSGRLNKGTFALSLKRIMDVAVAGLGGLILFPVILLVALLVRANMGAPVLFRQVRPGLHGRAFVMYKFRTMREVRERDRLAPDAQRLSRLGRFLRSTSLDELPELYNVLKGEMSLVGPRPLLMEYLPLYTPEQARRHSVKPGITGWAQVNGRNAISWEEKFQLDVWYVDNQSLWLDFKILWITLFSLLTRKGITPQTEAIMPRFTGSRK